MADYEPRGPQPAVSYAPTYTPGHVAAPAPAKSLPELALERLRAIGSSVDRIAQALAALPADPTARRIMLASLEQQITALAGDATFSNVSVRSGVGEVAQLRDQLAQRIAEVQIQIADARSPVTVSQPVAEEQKHSDPLAGVSDEHRAAATYLYARSNLAWQALDTEKASLVWPALGFGVTWTDEKLFTQVMFAALKDGIGDFEPGPLRSALYPFDPYEVVERWYKTNSKFAPLIAREIGIQLQQVVVASLMRLAPRFAAAADTLGVTRAVELGDLVLSSPIDSYVARGLVAPGTVVVRTHAKGRVADVPRVIRPVTITWLGARDPHLWNWVETDRPDSTVEEVAAAIYGHTTGPLGDSASVYAYGFTAAPPFFGVPKAWAKEIPDAADHRPALDSTLEWALDENLKRDELVSLVNSAEFGDRAALHQVEGTTVAPLEPVTLRERFGDCAAQLLFVRSELAAWGIEHDVSAAFEFVVRRQRDLATHTLEQRTSWSAVAIGQFDRLSQAAVAIRDLGVAARSLGITDLTGSDVDGLREVTSQFGAAAATAHLAKTGEAQLASARAAQGRLALQSLEQQLTTLAADQTTMRLVGGNDTHAKLQAADYEVTMAAGRTLVSQMANGHRIDEAELERVQLDAQELSMRADVHTLQVQFTQLAAVADKADDGFIAWFTASFSDDFKSVAEVSQYVLGRLGDIQQTYFIDKTAAQTRKSDAERARDRREALAKAQDALAGLRKERDLERFLVEGMEHIEDHTFRTTVVTIVSLLIPGVGAARAGAYAGGRLAARLMTARGAAAVTELALGARAAIAAATLVVDVGVSTVAQTALTGQSLLRSGSENLMSHILVKGVQGALGPVFTEIANGRKIAQSIEDQFGRLLAQEGKQAAAAGRVAQQTRGAVKWGAHQALTLSGEVVMGLAVAAAIQIAHGAPARAAADPESVFLEGFASAMGRILHTRLEHSIPRLEKLAELTDPSPTGQQLHADAVALQRLATTAQREHHGDDGLALWTRYEALQRRHLELLEWMSTSSARHADGPSADQLAAMKAEVSDELVAMRSPLMFDLRAKLLGLEIMVPGSLYKGTATEARRLAVEAQRAGHVVAQAWDGDRKVTTLDVDGRTLEIHERPEVTPKTDRTDDPTHELSTRLPMVAGSAMRKVESSGDNQALQAAVAPSLARISAEAGVISIEPGRAKADQVASEFIVEMADGAFTSVEIVTVTVVQADAARIVANSSRRFKHGDRTVQGEHLIQISSALAPEHLDRVLAHAVARVVEVHRRALAGSHPGGEPDSDALGPDDIGRLAEVRVLARQLAAAPTAEQKSAVGKELILIAEHLGVREQTPAADARLARLDRELASAEQRAALRYARNAKDFERNVALDAAHHDLVLDAERRARRKVERDAPYDLAGPGEQISSEDLARYAQQAAQLRRLTSDATLAKLRAQAAKLPAGKYVKVERIQIGGGAALAGRHPDALLVDGRGRWQADASEHIAQTAQQLQELFQARFGDVRQVAGPNERIPLDAISFWEDTIAAQGPVINGVGNLRIDDQQRVLLDINPDAGGLLTVEVGGTPVIATGFAPEVIPGGSRKDIYQLVTALEVRLDDIAGRNDVDETTREAAATTLARLRRVDRPRAHDPTDLAKVFADAPASLLARLQDASDGTGAVAAIEALEAIDTGMAWKAVKEADAADGMLQIVTGDEANLTATITAMLNRPSPPRRWVFAGSGGTSISAAEIILARPGTSVVMQGRDSPAGLLENGQAMALMKKFADPALAAKLGISPGAEPRLSIEFVKDLEFATPTLTTRPDGTQAVVSHSSAGAVEGDAYVVSSGRWRQAPSFLSDLVLAERRKGSTVKFKVLDDQDDQYVGYRVTIKPEDGGKLRKFDVTGAASRMAPIHEFSPEDQARIRAASRQDAHDKTGSFDAGFGPSGVQGARRGAEDNLREEDK